MSCLGWLECVSISMLMTGTPTPTPTHLATIAFYLGSVFMFQALLAPSCAEYCWSYELKWTRQEVWTRLKYVQLELLSLKRHLLFSHMHASCAWQHRVMISEMPLRVRYLCTDLLSTDAFDSTSTPPAVIKEKEMFLPPQPLWFTVAHTSECVGLGNSGPSY